MSEKMSELTSEWVNSPAAIDRGEARETQKHTPGPWMYDETAEIIRCLMSDMDTDAGRARYAESIARNGGGSEYAKAAEYFKKLFKARGAENQEQKSIAEFDAALLKAGWLTL